MLIRRVGSEKNDSMYVSGFHFWCEELMIRLTVLILVGETLASGLTVQMQDLS